MWDLLGLALRAIPAVPVEYCRRLASYENEMGMIVGSFAAPVTIAKAHVQGVRTSMIEQLGLQIGDNYRLVHVAADAWNVVGDPKGGDKLKFYGKTWTIAHVSPHYAEDGWNKLVVVEDKPYTGAVSENEVS